MTTDLLTAAVRTVPSLAVAFAYAWLLWRLLARTGPTGAAGQRFSRVPAVLTHRLSLVAGLTLGLLGVLPDVDPAHPWESLLLVVVEGAWVLLAILTANVVVDRLLLPKVPNLSLIAQGNLGIALAEAGFYLGLGLILWGSLTGSAPSALVGAASTIGFYILGVLFVIALFWLREWATPYQLRERLADGDVAAGADLCGTLVGTSAVVAVACSGDFVDWPTSLRSFAATAVVSVALLHLLRLGARYLVLGRSTRQIHDDRDAPAAAVLGAVMALSGLAVATVALTVL